MITKEQVIQMAREAGGETRYFSLDRVEGFSFFTMPEFERFAAACYRQGVEDALEKVIELGVVSIDGRFSDEIRALLEETE